MRGLGGVRRGAGVFVLGLALTACTQTYAPDRVKESIQEICRAEYGIEKIDVKIVGSTIGVFLPLKKLFATDFKETLLAGKTVADVEDLFHPSPEALDQVEDVLFSISRVLLSTELKLQFYVLQATDVEKTGLQLVLIGYVDDIKRVRLWDISRNEYRKRVLHEIRLNRAVVWHRPVTQFFGELEKSPTLEFLQPSFVRPLSPSLVESLFFFNPESSGERSAHWRLGELRSTLVEPTRVLVHVPVELEYDPQKVAPGAFKVPAGSALEYFMIVSFASEPGRILRVIPISYLDAAGAIQKFPLSNELNFQTDPDSWQIEFPLTEIRLGDFLAEQLSRRTQALLTQDERVHNTFEEVRMSFRYQKDVPQKYFSLELDVKPKGHTPQILQPSALNEDVLYLLNLASREFVDLLRSYQFSDYEFLQLNLVSDPLARILAREELELFRRNKADLQGILGGVSPF